MIKSRSVGDILLALGFALMVPAIGYFYLGLLYAALFTAGYIGGFILWIIVKTTTSWESIRTPFWLTMGAFLFLHKVEENRMKFFEVMSENITGDPVPGVTTGLIIGMLIIPIGTWLLIPFLVKRGSEIGYYFAWSFFASMGITELAHFVLPLFTGESYGYFPGMISVIVLAPLAWWGMLRLLAHKQRLPDKV